jgi:hypothetical protein
MIGPDAPSMKQSGSCYEKGSCYHPVFLVEYEQQIGFTWSQQHKHDEGI